MQVASHANQPVLSPQATFFVQYAAAMSQAREKTKAVIESRDVSNVNEIGQRAAQAPVLDARAGEFRDRLLAILTRAVNAVSSASPAPGDGPRRQPPLEDPKLAEDFAQWQREYDQWLEQAVQTYMSGQSK
jgi:hypothetical protein